MTGTEMSDLAMPDRAIWSVTPGAIDRAAADSVVLLVPDGGDLARAFRRAAEVLAVGDTNLRLIGRGVTMDRLWPSWVRSARNIVLTELDAYLPGNRAPLLEPMVTAGRAWLGATFEGALGDLAPEQVLWATGANRLLLRAFAAWPLVVGVAHHHGCDSVECFHGAWAGADALSRELGTRGGRFVLHGPRPKETVPWMVRAGARIGSVGLASLGVRLGEFWSERRARRQVRRLRDTGATPAVWVGVIGDQPAASRHAMTAAQAIARASAERVGILLQSSLAPGAASVFPALDSAELNGIVATVDQCVADEAWRELIAGALSWAEQAVKVTRRVAAAGPLLPLGPISVRLDSEIDALARLITIDLLRAREAHRAAVALTRRRSFRGKRVLWPHASLATATIPDVVLQHDGATTYEIVHGAFPDRVDVMTYASSNSTVRIASSAAEARFLAPYVGRQQCVGGFGARALSTRSRRQGVPKILSLTNYGHGLGTQIKERPELDSYQRAFWCALGSALRGSPRVEIRWRPHPQDEPASIARSLADVPLLTIDLSHNVRGLDEDLDWADIVIGAWSTSLVHALTHPVAVFVHDIPLYESVAAVAAFAPARRFSDGAQLEPRLADLMNAFAQNAPDALDPEADARRALFGSSAGPRPFEFVLREGGGHQAGAPPRLEREPS